MQNVPELLDNRIAGKIIYVDKNSTNGILQDLILIDITEESLFND